MLAQPALEVSNLTKLYGSFRAVDGVTFSVPKGSIRYFGQDLHRHREACLQRTNFSSSYNDPQGWISVWENLVVFASRAPIRWADIAIAAAESIVYFSVAVWFFNYMDGRSRETGHSPATRNSQRRATSPAVAGPLGEEQPPHFF